MPPSEPIRSVKRIREHQQALASFREAFLLNLSDGSATHRTQVNQAIPAAERAIAATGLGVEYQPPPVARGDPPWQGLTNIAFLHERPGYRPKDRIYGGHGSELFVTDVVAQGIAYLDERRKDLERERHRPTYWPDRILRALLGFPAYVIELVSGVSRWQIEGSRAGPPLRFLAAGAEVFTILGAGRALKLW
jgi:hypothetical protein